MRNITLSLPDDVYRRARIEAAERGTSVSSLVGEFLRSLSDGDAEFRRLEAQQHAALEELDRFRAGDRLERDQAHDRAVR